MSRRLTLSLAGAVLMAGSAACAHAADPASTTSAPARDTSDAAGPGAVTESVVAITLDGLNPAAIRRLGRGGAPTLSRLIRQGASTMNARTAYEKTETLPNHTSMVTGRRIDARSGGHGVTWNDERKTPRTVQAAAGEPVGSVFSAVHDAGLSSSLFSSKTKFSLWLRSWPEAIDASAIVEDNKTLVTRFIDDLSTPRAFRFLHLSAPDVTGHKRGFMGTAYLRAVRRSDGQLRRVVRAVTDSGVATTILITSDHGGRGSGHYSPTSLGNYRIPFIAWGTGVERGADLYDLNEPVFQDPRRTRTTYSEQPVRNGDVANLALDLLGLAAVVDSEFDVAQDLELSRP